jgi:hypothetical protein
LARHGCTGPLPYPNFIDQCIELPDNSAKSVEELLPFGRQYKRPLRAIDKLDPKELLEMLNALARGALRHAMLDGRLGKAPFPNHVEKYF